MITAMTTAIQEAMITAILEATMITATQQPMIIAILVATATPLEATTTIQPGKEAIVMFNTTTIQAAGVTGFITVNLNTTRRTTMDTLTTMDGTRRLEPSTKVTI